MSADHDYSGFTVMVIKAERIDRRRVRALLHRVSCHACGAKTDTDEPGPRIDAHRKTCRGTNG